MAGDKKVKAIFFDLGDTLLDFGPVNTGELFLDGAKRTFSQLQQWSEPLPTFATYHRRLLRSVHWSYFKSRVTGREFNSLDVIRKRCTAMGQNLSQDQYEQLCWLWYEPLAEMADLTPNLNAILNAFKADGLCLGIISNTFIPACVLDRHLEQLDLKDIFDMRLYSCDFGYRKPNRKIFAHALDLTGQSAANTMFVGDTPRPDIFGANQMGMISVLKDPTNKYRRKRSPDYEIDSLLELPAIVAELNGFSSAVELTSPC